MSEGTEAAVSRLERGEKCFSKDMALVLLITHVHVFAHAHMYMCIHVYAYGIVQKSTSAKRRRMYDVLHKFLHNKKILWQKCLQISMKIANRRIKFLADIAIFVTHLILPYPCESIFSHIDLLLLTRTTAHVHGNGNGRSKVMFNRSLLDSLMPVIKEHVLVRCGGTHQV